MSADTILATLGRAYVSRESAFGTPGTYVSCFPVAESLQHSCKQEQLDRKTLNVRPFDVKTPIKSYKSATAKFDVYLQPSSTRLIEGATVPTGSSEPHLWVLLRTLFGGISVESGGEVATGVSASSATLEAGQGAKFPAGQLCLIEDSTNGLVAARVLSRSTDTLTFWPSLSGTNSTGDDFVNAATFYISRTNTGSLAFRFANAQDSDYQWTLVGGTGSLEFKLERGQLALASVDLTFASFTGASDQSITNTHLDDTMLEPFAVRNVLVYLQTPATTTRTAYPIEALSIKLNLGNAHRKVLVGGTEGVGGVVRSENLYEPCATVELTFESDLVAQNTWYGSRTDLSLLIVIPADLTAGRRAIIIDCPLVRVREYPDLQKGDNNLLKTKLMLDCYLDTGCSGTLDNQELAQAGIRLGMA
jgi:hypothetical protein